MYRVLFWNITLNFSMSSLRKQDSIFCYSFLETSYFEALIFFLERFNVQGDWKMCVIQSESKVVCFKDLRNSWPRTMGSEFCFRDKWNFRIRNISFVSLTMNPGDTEYLHCCAIYLVSEFFCGVFKHTRRLSLQLRADERSRKKERHAGITSC